MEKTEQALAIVRQRGPIIPSQIASEIKTDILLASAILSDLSSSGKIKISSLKMGGSPFYYCEGQEELLQNYLKYLNPKQMEAFNLLKASQILRDKELTPVLRVALREIKDFAKQLEVSLDGSKEVFWKWYLLGKDAAESIIKQKLGVAEKKEAEKTEIQMPLPEALQQPVEAPVPAKPVKKEATPSVPSGAFFEEILKFFGANSIQILEQNAVKKSEFEFTIKFQTPLGEMKYYCAAKSKKRVDADDLSSAFARGQMKNLPVLFLTQGALSKDAEAIVAKGLNITVKKI
ncbi:MAG: hypothetical protein V1702_02610 [Candidatus Woesearchaeota archaeon]